MSTQIDQCSAKLEIYREGDRIHFDARCASWFNMAPDEARRLAHALLDMADRIESRRRKFTSGRKEA